MPPGEARTSSCMACSRRPVGDFKSAGHSTPYGNSIPYGKLVTNNHLRAENLQKRYYQQISQLRNPLLLGEIILKNGRIIPNKEELVVYKEKEISSPKLEEDKILPREGRRGLLVNLTL